MKDVKVLFVCSEVAPYLPENNISTICRKLPQAIQEMGNEIRTFVPRYGCINERRHQLHEVIRLSGINIIINENDYPLVIKVASIPSARMQVYFIDNEDFFRRKATFADDKGKYFADNDERAIFFARGVLETIKKLQWVPDIIHCHGWFTYLVPMFLKKEYKEDVIFDHTKIITSVYDDKFTGKFGSDLEKKLVSKAVKPKNIETLTSNPNYENLVKFAIDYSDGVVYGSSKISKEILDYVKTSKKKFLEYEDTDKYAENYSKFYDKIL